MLGISVNTLLKVTKDAAIVSNKGLVEAKSKHKTSGKSDPNCCLVIKTIVIQIIHTTTLEWQL